MQFNPLGHQSLNIIDDDMRLPGSAMAGGRTGLVYSVPSLPAQLILLAGLDQRTSPQCTGEPADALLDD